MWVCGLCKESENLAEDVLMKVQGGFFEIFERKLQVEEFEGGEEFCLKS